ncbi:MAG: outer membrane protein assembly factor [Thermodesulfovibrionales bacterium]
MKTAARFAAVLLGMLLAATCRGWGVPATAEAARVGAISVIGLTSMGEEELLSMLGIRTGDPADGERVRSGIKRAFLKGVFDDVDVLVGDGDPAPVTVVVREKNVIRAISLTGDYRLAKKTLRSLIPFQEGEALRLELIPRAQEEIRRAISQYGYPDAAVSIAAERTGRPNSYDLIVAVDTNAPQIIGSIRLIGPAPGVLEMLKISPGDVYDQVRLRDELQRVKQSLKREGYVAPVLGPWLYRNGELEIQANIGKRLEIVIEGNSALSTKTLMKGMPFFDAEALNDELIGEASDRIINQYHSEGYAFCQVAPVVNENDEASVVSFFIFEGEKITTDRIVFDGASLEPSVLKSVMSLKEGGPYNPDRLDNDQEALKEFYAALGYLEAAVDPIKSEADRDSGLAKLSVVIREGVRTEIASIDIAVGDEALRAKLLDVILIRPGDPYNEVDLADARYRLLDYYANAGYSDIDVDVQRSIEHHRAAIVFRVIEGTKVRFGRFVVSGNQKTKYPVIRREVLHQEGEPYNLRSVAALRQRLFKLGLFSDVDIEDVESGPDTRDLLIKVKEANAGSVELGIGYGDYENLRGFFEVSYRNLMGMNRQGSLRTELSGLEKRVIAQYTEPWFLNRPLPLRVMFLFENKKEITIPGGDVRYRLRRFTASAGTEKKLTERIKAEFAYEFSLVKTTDVQPDVVLSREDVGTLAISALRSMIVYDSRDNPVEPTRGILAGAAVKIASPLLFSESSFITGSVSGSIFLPLHKRVVLALLARGGLAEGFNDTNELPIVERFFLGGRSTVRGYEQDMLGPKGFDGNPTGGNVFVMGNIELRVSLGRGFGLVPFFDVGNVWVDLGDFSPSDLKYTAGIGIRYATPVGPLRVDYGFKLNRDRGESSGEIHFSVGHAF